MGLDAVLTVIPASEYRKLRADPRHYVPRAVSKFDLYREWNALDVALNWLGNPLGLALRGDRPDLESFEDDWEIYSAIVTGALVKKLAKALTKVTAKLILAALKDAGWRLTASERKDCVSALKTLNLAYRSAAKNSAIVCILIC